jgi:ribosome biogenesis GTPase
MSENTFDSAMGLDALGWSPALAEDFVGHGARGLVPARVTAEHRGAYAVRAIRTEGPAAGLAVVSGRYRYGSTGPADFPAVGDWVAIDGSPAGEGVTIHARLPRRTAFSRLAAGRRTEAQVVAANVDVVFVAMGLDRDFNLRRLERYLAVAWGSGASPVVLLTKADRCPHVDGHALAAQAAAPGVPVLPISALSGAGLDAVRVWLTPGRTAAVLGSSGVGKSTLINVLAGHEALATREVRAGDDRGRHTTTHRQLLVLPGGGLIIDTPGMRELGLWEGGEAVGETFAEIDELATSCRFADCRHEREPGCAVLAAIGDGRLPAQRLRNRRKMEREEIALDVHPGVRRQGVGRAILHGLEELARDMAAEVSTQPRRFYASWCVDSAEETRTLLTDEGYRPVRYFVEMVRDALADVPPVPLPDGLEMRPVEPADHRRIFDAQAEAFRDHWGARDWTDEMFEGLFRAPDLDTSLWRVAWAGDEVASVCANWVYAAENERLGVRRAWLEQVSVRRPWRRRGVARALIAASLHAFAERGLTSAALGVDSDNPTGALGLYEGLGFRVHKPATSYRKGMP